MYEREEFSIHFRVEATQAATEAAAMEPHISQYTHYCIYLLCAIACYRYTRSPVQCNIERKACGNELDKGKRDREREKREEKKTREWNILYAGYLSLSCVKCGACKTDSSPPRARLNENVWCCCLLLDRFLRFYFQPYTELTPITPLDLWLSVSAWGAFTDWTCCACIGSVEL